MFYSNQLARERRYSGCQSGNISLRIMQHGPLELFILNERTGDVLSQVRRIHSHLCEDLYVWADMEGCAGTTVSGAAAGRGVVGYTVQHSVVTPGSGGGSEVDAGAGSPPRAPSYAIDGLLPIPGKTPIVTIPAHITPGLVSHTLLHIMYIHLHLQCAHPRRRDLGP